MKTNRIAAAAGLFITLAGPWALADNPDNPKFSYGNETQMTQGSEWRRDTNAAPTRVTKSRDAMNTPADAMTPPRASYRSTRAMSTGATLANPDGRDYKPN